ncbi:hypothetical protein LOK49_LG02G01221 [Camellia lanceoleosa]|uniref:Uncharacterized protein n=1 Tax=Camellia lanceoleosa TaxID=1840588 RepID=A0ACC0ISY5_9ERIC|nr:hypothetical protein LOK49_LG02G01221 [Camellia lanceoleosa]
MSVESLKGIFQRYGKVLNASIPDKRTKRYNSRFGFICYDKLDSTEEATRKFNRTWYGENRLIVKPTRFDKPFPFSSMPLTPTSRSQPPNVSNNQPRHGIFNVTFADVVKRKPPIESSLAIQAEAVGNDWLYRSVVIRASLPNVNQCIKESFSLEDVNIIQVRPKGGKYYILTFHSRDDMKLKLAHEKEWFTSRFEYYKEWSDSDFSKYSF